jgi:spore coat polysaccharide biosynthesis protein SpsF
MNMRVVGTIEARMGSSRLPGKTLTSVSGNRTLLECVVTRFRRCRLVDGVYVATTTSGKDDAIAGWCEGHGVKYFRGSENDVLDRVVKTAQQAGADAVVQMGADSAYLDSDLIDELVEYFKGGFYDYVCNDMELTYPLGIYGHVVRFSALFRINQRDLSEAEREDVVRCIFEHPEHYAILNVKAPASLACPQLRLTIDYPEDLRLAGEIYRHFGTRAFSTPDLIDLYRKNPGIFEDTLRLVQASASFLNPRNGYRTITGRVH